MRRSFKHLTLPAPLFGVLPALFILLPSPALGQDSLTSRLNLSALVRAKAEVQTAAPESRFEVRNARVALDGSLSRCIAWRAEIDLCDEGNMRMLDAFAAVRPARHWRVRIGQMRVPFSIDAHRTPHEQHFANRSFLAKQVGDVRDVGCDARFRHGMLSVEAGLFNGSGLTGQKDYWTRSLNFSAKAALTLPCGVLVETSAQKVHPACGAQYLVDSGISWTLADAFTAGGTLFVEGEWMQKVYASHAFPSTGACNALVTYSLPLRCACRTELSPHMLTIGARYDFMQNHSDGKTLADDGRHAVLTDCRRSRLTTGLTLRFRPLAKALQKGAAAGKAAPDALLRLNHEKYFYPAASRPLAKRSERDKVTLEVVVCY